MQNPADGPPEAASVRRRRGRGGLQILSGGSQFRLLLYVQAECQCDLPHEFGEPLDLPHVDVVVDAGDGDVAGRLPDRGLVALNGGSRRVRHDVTVLVVAVTMATVALLKTAAGNAARSASSACAADGRPSRSPCSRCNAATNSVRAVRICPTTPMIAAGLIDQYMDTARGPYGLFSFQNRVSRSLVKTSSSIRRFCGPYWVI